MPYPEHSVEHRFLENDPLAVGQVLRWIAVVLTSPRFWPLQAEWADLHQEVLTRLVESLFQGRFDATKDFRLYVQGVARFTALQALARQSQFRFDPSREPADPGEPAQAESRATQRQLIRRVLDDASAECRELIRAYFLEEKSYAELGEELGLPVGTVKSRLFRCLERAHADLCGKKSPPAGKVPLK